MLRWYVSVPSNHTSAHFARTQTRVYRTYECIRNVRSTYIRTYSRHMSYISCVWPVFIIISCFLQVFPYLPSPQIYVISFSISLSLLSLFVRHLSHISSIIGRNATAASAAAGTTTTINTPTYRLFAPTHRELLFKEKYNIIIWRVMTWCCLLIVALPFRTLYVCVCYVHSMKCVAIT